MVHFLETLGVDHEDAAVPSAIGILSVCVGVLAYVLYLATGNMSWVDRSWSLMPAMYVWLGVVFLEQPSTVVVVPSSDLIIMPPVVLASLDRIKANVLALPFTGRGILVIVVSLWSCRLTFNYWRRGGYQAGFEDHRWHYVRKMINDQNKLVWHLFCIVIVSLYQSVLLFAIAVPVFVVPPAQTVTTNEAMCAAAALLMIGLETLADEQQQAFQNEKRNHRPRRADLEADYKEGFLTHGLFALSRHPNLFFEQMIWLSIYMVSAKYIGLFNALLLPWVTLVLLMWRGCVLQETITAPKYKRYKEYQQHVPMLVPMWLVPRWSNDVVSHTD